MPCSGPFPSEVTGSLDPATTDCERAADDPAGAPEGNCTDTASKTWEPIPTVDPDEVDVVRRVGLRPAPLRNRGVARGRLRNVEIVVREGPGELAERARPGCFRRQQVRV